MSSSHWQEWPTKLRTDMSNGKSSGCTVAHVTTDDRHMAPKSNGKDVSVYIREDVYD